MMLGNQRKDLTKIITGELFGIAKSAGALQGEIIPAGIADHKTTWSSTEAVNHDPGELYLYSMRELQATLDLVLYVQDIRKRFPLGYHTSSSGKHDSPSSSRGNFEQVTASAGPLQELSRKIERQDAEITALKEAGEAERKVQSLAITALTQRITCLEAQGREHAQADVYGDDTCNVSPLHISKMEAQIQHQAEKISNLENENSQLRAEIYGDAEANDTITGLPVLPGFVYALRRYRAEGKTCAEIAMGLRDDFGLSNEAITFLLYPKKNPFSLSDIDQYARHLINGEVKRQKLW